MQRRKFSNPDHTHHTLFQVSRNDIESSPVVGVVQVRKNCPWSSSMEDEVMNYICGIFPPSLFDISYLLWDAPLLVQDYANRNNISIEMMLPPGGELFDLTLPY